MFDCVSLCPELSVVLDSVLNSLMNLYSHQKLNAVPIDIFSPMFINLLLHRYQSQLEVVNNMEAYDLFRLSELYVKNNDISVETGNQYIN